MSSTPQSSTNSHTFVDHIPVIWFEPQVQRPGRQLILYPPPFSSTKELMIPYLEDIAAKGFVALSLDPWQHGKGLFYPVTAKPPKRQELRRYNEWKAGKET